MWVHFGRRGWHGLAAAALCAAVGGPARAQILTSVQTPTPNSAPTQTVTAPDGTIWFVETAADHIGTITPYRSYIGEVNLTLPGSRPTAIALDNKGAAWFTESGTNKIGAYTRATNYLVEYQVPGANLGLSGISVDSFGKVWFTAKFSNQVGVLNPANLSISYVNLGTTNVGLQGIVASQTGQNQGWFTQTQSNQIGMIDLSTNNLYQYSGGFSQPWGIDLSPVNNNVWFTQQGNGMITSLDQNSGSLFQFPTLGGAASKPSYLSAFQTQSGQSYVGYAQTGTNQIGILNPFTGNQTQIQSQGQAPTGFSYSGLDNTLWWSNTGSSNLTGSYFNSSIVRREPLVGEPILASLFDSLFSITKSRASATGTPYAGYAHMRLASVVKKHLSVRTVRVAARASYPPLDGLRPGSDDARIVLTQFHTASAPVTQEQFTAQIQVVNIGPPTQVNPFLQYRAIPTNAEAHITQVNGVPWTGARDQVDVNVGDCITLQLLVKFRTGAFVDVTNDPLTTFSLDPPRGHFSSKNVWCANPEDADKAFPIYLYNYSPSGEQGIKTTVHVHVRR